MAQPTSPHAPGLLERFGLPTQTQEEILEQRTNAKLKEALISTMQSAPKYKQPFENAAFKTGALLGTKFSGGNKGELTESELGGLDALDKSKVKFELWRRQNPEASPEDTQDKQQRLLAEELIKQGDPRGVQMAVEVTERSRARKRATLELEKLEGGVAEQAIRIEQQEFSLNKAKTGLVDEIWLRGETDPDAHFAGNINPDNSVSFNGEDGQVKTLQPGEYMLQGPLTPKQRGVRDDRTSSSTWSKKALDDLRARQRSTKEQIRQAHILKTSMADAAKASPTGQVNIMGKAGGLSQWYVETMDTLGALARIAGGDVEIIDGNAKGKNLSNPDDALSYVKQDFGEFDALMKNLVPEHLRDQVRAREQFYAAAVSMQFTQARTNEDGARLSDQDIKLAAKQLATQTSDPEALRGVMVQNVLNNIQKYRDMEVQLNDDFRDTALTPESQRLFDESEQGFLDAFVRDPETGRELDFGPPGAPTRDLLGEEFGTADAPIPDDAVSSGDGFTVF